MSSAVGFFYHNEGGGNAIARGIICLRDTFMYWRRESAQRLILGHAGLTSFSDKYFSLLESILFYRPIKLCSISYSRRWSLSFSASGSTDPAISLNMDMIVSFYLLCTSSRHFATFTSSSYWRGKSFLIIGISVLDTDRRSVLTDTYAVYWRGTLSITSFSPKYDPD